jgi:hypothetical protein
MFEKLLKEFKGWTIENWDSSEHDECTRITLSKGDEWKVVHLGTTDLGLWVYKVNPYDKEDNKEDISGELLDKVRMGFLNHVEKHDEEEEYFNAYNATDEQCEERNNILRNMIKPIDDVFNLTFGFVCEKCKEEWSISLKDVKKSSNKELKELMQTPEGRLKIAQDIFGELGQEDW